MSILDSLSEGFADLVLMSRENDGGFRTMFATVVAVTADGATVMPDSMTTGAIGPLQLVCGKAVANARVLCLYLPDNKVWVVIGK